jgi:hypothetical protein
MASPQASAKLTSKLKVASFDHDPGGTSAVLLSGDGGTTISYVDGRDYSNFLFIAKPSVLAGNGITKLEIVASATTTFAAVTVIKDSGTVAADAIADYVVEECTAEEIAQEASDAGVELRYVTARLTCHNAGDEAVVTFVGVPRHAYLGLTADNIT